MSDTQHLSNHYPSLVEGMLSHPLPFPSARMQPCTSINTKAYDPHSNRTAVIKHVLVFVDDDDDISYSTEEEDEGGNDSEVMMDVSVCSSRGDDNSFEPLNCHYVDQYVDRDMPLAWINSRAKRGKKPSPQTHGTPASQQTSGYRNLDDDQDYMRSSERAYWLQETLSKCIYGVVRKAVELRRRMPTSENDAEWQLSFPRIEYAIKLMRWESIQECRMRGEAEDPIKEVAAMQFITSLPSTKDKKYVLQLKDLLFDDRYLYSVMPFCNGGELFDNLTRDSRGRFPEKKAKELMVQMLCSLRYVHNIAGVCHRDISLENFMVHKDDDGDIKSIMIDLGMCLRVPHITDDEGIVRYLMMPAQGMCGKFFYMSPEVFRNEGPFDGFKCDMWALGVILYMVSICLSIDIFHNFLRIFASA